MIDFVLLEGLYSVQSWPGRALIRRKTDGKWRVKNVWAQNMRGLQPSNRDCF